MTQGYAYRYEKHRYQWRATLEQLAFPVLGKLIVHHKGHGNKTRSRGSFALTGAVDAEFRVEKDVMVMTAINTKMKDAPTPAPIAFDMVEIELGQNMTSLALRETEVAKRPPRVTGHPMHKSPRCTAHSKRTGLPCCNPAVRGWKVCRMHGARGGQPPLSRELRAP